MTIFLSTPVIGADWETNPAFLSGIKKDSIFSSYSATFGSGDFENRSHSLGNAPYSSYLDSHMKTFNHSLNLGYVKVLSPGSNFGIFTSHNLGLNYTSGIFHQLFEASGQYYIEDYESESKSNLVSLGTVYTKWLSRKIVLGGSFSFGYTKYRDGITYNTIATNRLPRYSDYGNSLEKYDFEGALGLGWIAAKNLDLYFVVSAGGSFGNITYEECLSDYSNINETYNYDNNGDTNGLRIRTEIDGIFRVSKYFNIPFSLSYSYGDEGEGYDGFGIYKNNMGVYPYYMAYESDSFSNTITFGAGVRYYPTGSSRDWNINLWSFYRYYNKFTETDSITDERYAGPGYHLAKSMSETLYNNHSVGFSVGASVPIKAVKNLRLSFGLNYNYTFINMDQKKINYQDGNFFSNYVYSGEGHSQYLGLKLGLNYKIKKLNISLSSTIPILSESYFEIDGTNSENLFLAEPINSSTKRMDYGVVLSISYSF